MTAPDATEDLGEVRVSPRMGGAPHERPEESLRRVLGHLERRLVGMDEEVVPEHLEERLAQGLRSLGGPAARGATLVGHGHAHALFLRPHAFSAKERLLRAAIRGLLGGARRLRDLWQPAGLLGPLRERARESFDVRLQRLHLALKADGEGAPGASVICVAVVRRYQQGVLIATRVKGYVSPRGSDVAVASAATQPGYGDPLE